MKPTPEQFLEAVKTLDEKFGADPEAFHGETDELMEDTLTVLGYGDGIELIRKQTRWYS